MAAHHGDPCINEALNSLYEHSVVDVLAFCVGVGAVRGGFEKCVRVFQGGLVSVQAAIKQHRLQLYPKATVRQQTVSQCEILRNTVL